MSNSDDSTAPQPDLSTTLDAFATRIQRRKDALRASESEAERAQKARHSLLLNSMMNIRRSLAQIAQIDLGDRFSLALTADDWQGWPRLVVRLTDVLESRAEYPYFQVIAHDRQEQGVIELSLSTTTKPEKLSLIDQQDAAKLPNVLKKLVRTYLDHVEQIVVESETRDEQDYAATPIDLSPPKQEQSQENELSGDIFVDEHELVDENEKLPVLEELDSLPEINSKLNLD